MFLTKDEGFLNTILLNSGEISKDLESLKRTVQRFLQKEVKTTKMAAMVLQSKLSPFYIDVLYEMLHANSKGIHWSFEPNSAF